MKSTTTNLVIVILYLIGISILIIYVCLNLTNIAEHRQTNGSSIINEQHCLDTNLIVLSPDSSLSILTLEDNLYSPNQEVNLELSSSSTNMGNIKIMLAILAMIFTLTVAIFGIKTFADANKFERDLTDSRREINTLTKNFKKEIDSGIDAINELKSSTRKELEEFKGIVQEHGLEIENRFSSIEPKVKELAAVSNIGFDEMAQLMKEFVKTLEVDLSIEPFILRRLDDKILDLQTLTGLYTENNSNLYSAIDQARVRGTLILRARLIEINRSENFSYKIRKFAEEASVAIEEREREWYLHFKDYRKRKKQKDS